MCSKLFRVLLIIACMVFPSACGSASISEADLTAYTDDLAILDTHPHDTNSFTEGLFCLDGQLYESTGLYGQSRLLKHVSLDTGLPEDDAQLSDDLFGEGCVYFLDWNKMQIDGSNDAVMTLGDPAAKFRAFGWNANVVDGGDVSAIHRAVEAAVAEKNGTPTMIVLDTVKGAGVTCVSQMANNHCIGFPGALLEQAMEELIARGRALGMEVRKCL